MSHTLFVIAFGKAISKISRDSQIFLSIDQLLQAFPHGSARTYIRTRPVIKLKATPRLSHSIAQLASISECDQQQWRHVDQMPLAAQKLRHVKTPKAGRSRFKLKIWSRAKVKRNRPSPSTSLINALAECGYHHVIPPLINSKRDLSYTKADTLAPLRQQKWIIRGTHEHAMRMLFQSQSGGLTLPGILARYLRTTHGLLSSISFEHPDGPSDCEMYDLISTCFTDTALVYLRKRGFDGPDVMTWAWIITADTAQKSLWRLLAIASGRQRDVCETIPTFVFLFILRRTYISPGALKLCLAHAWDRLKNRPTTSSPIRSQKGADIEMDVFSGDCREEEFSRKKAVQRTQMDGKSVVVMVVRLLRHARQVWPFAIADISRLFSTYIDGRYGTSRSIAFPLSVETAIRLTSLYNRILFILSHPPSIHKFLSVPYCQHAQLHLVQQMAQFQPPLLINRQGYRALARVQLARKKTAQERDWAGLKAKSWPPWKVERTGLDVDKGAEYGTTRARQVLIRMQEAGYSPGRWGEVANIYTGWDTDGSPTIQTRTTLPTVVVAEKRRNRVFERDEALWAARIRCTRTLNEAWACFIAYGDVMKTQSEDVYLEMFEKLVYHRRGWKQIMRHDSSTAEAVIMDSDSAAMPGDGREVLPEPISPNEITFVRSRPPSITEFCEQLYRGGVWPSERFLSLIVSNAESLESGLHFLYVWTASTSRIALAEALHNPLLMDFSKHLRAGKIIKDMPYRIFLAIIQLLCRFRHSAYPISALRNPRSVAHSNPRISSHRPYHGPIAGITSSPLNPLAQAIRLVLYRNPKHSDPWNLLLQSLARPQATLGGRSGYDTDRRNSQLHDILSWKAIVQLVRHVRDYGVSINLDGFAHLCRGLEKAIRACHMAETSLVQFSGIRAEVKAALAEGPKVLRSVFEELVGENVVTGSHSHVSSRLERVVLTWSRDGRYRLPMILATPHPAVLHAYIRVMGFLGDCHGILALIQWMARHSPDLRAIAVESRNGPRLQRMTLVAARSFVQRHIAIEEDGTADGASCSHDRLDADRRQILEELRETVEGVDGWGGWPTVDEAIKYRDGSSYRVNWLRAMQYHSRVAQPTGPTWS